MKVLLAPALCLLVACTTLGPDYQAPRPSLPATWSEAHDGSRHADTETLRTWWRRFDDPLLDRLVDQALANNQDLGIALARLRQARADRTIAAAGLGPTIGASGNLQALRSSRRTDPPGGGTTQAYGLGLDARWELDLFGGLRRGVEAADARVSAVEADGHALRVSLLAELATDYGQLRMTQARLAVSRDTIGLLRDSERIAERAWHAGLGTEADYRQARAERESAEAQPAQLEAGVARLTHAIGVLAGGFPGDWKETLLTSAPAPLLPPELPLAMPSEVIRQRPDLRADERRLAAATADIGVAEAARYPRFSIPLSIGTDAHLIHDLFSAASASWSAAIAGNQTVYDGGSNRAGVERAEAEAQAALLAWERDVRGALRDVEDALTGIDTACRRRDHLVAAIDDSRTALDRATRLYRQGLSGYQPVLTAQRSLNAVRDARLLNDQDELDAGIGLYKALGAGWDMPVNEASASQAPRRPTPR
ncbi:MAG: Solvent efflux pump outer membrane protein SrpC [Luteibacter sp.]|uniref:efflux transporter outer membrane subunit n=1 Tax=Luteibacter sp. TaxID=1886636 RepID=UPI0013815A27|nr:efflux transporter outer membrane subunit [Luteibacter sp.]KAF1004741.1 MAG: Solvent efflux pump outer membrane protein SrpC [Luteibacter sp.]